MRPNSLYSQRKIWQWVQSPFIVNFLWHIECSLRTSLCIGPSLLYSCPLLSVLVRVGFLAQTCVSLCAGPYYDFPVLTNKCMKEICSSSYVFREFQIKTMNYDYTPMRMTKIHNTDNIKCCSRAFIHYWCKCKMLQLLWRTCRQFLTKVKHSLTTWPSHCTPLYLSKWVENMSTQKPAHESWSQLYS